MITVLLIISRSFFRLAWFVILPLLVNMLIILLGLLLDLLSIILYILIFALLGTAKLTGDPQAKEAIEEWVVPENITPAKVTDIYPSMLGRSKTTYKW